MRACVRACVRAGVRACGRAGVRACGRAGVRACGRACGVVWCVCLAFHSTPETDRGCTKRRPPILSECISVCNDSYRTTVTYTCPCFVARGD